MTNPDRVALGDPSLSSPLSPSIHHYLRTQHKQIDHSLFLQYTPHHHIHSVTLNTYDSCPVTHLRQQLLPHLLARHSPLFVLSDSTYGLPLSGTLQHLLHHSHPGCSQVRLSIGHSSQVVSGKYSPQQLYSFGRDLLQSLAQWTTLTAQLVEEQESVMAECTDVSMEQYVDRHSLPSEFLSFVRSKYQHRLFPSGPSIL